MHLRIHNLRIKILLGFLLSCFAMQAQLEVPFTIRYQDNIKGDITQISNNIVNRDTNSYDPNDRYPQPWENSGYNDDYTMRYIDIDGDSSTFSSSSATLSSITDVSCSTVVYAAMYWSATYRYNSSSGSGSSTRVTNFNEVKLKLPGDANYTDITGTVIYDGFGSASLSSNSPYVCYADITTLVAGLADPNGTYTAANIRATQGSLSGGVSGGWTIFIVYENPNKPGKYVTSYDGFAGVNSGLGSIDVNYTGFTTVPAPLPVRAKLMACALEGDRLITGDRLRFKDASETNYTNLSNNLNPSDNFFNSNITYLDDGDVEQNFTDRVPNSSNTLGYDADIININQGLIHNSSTGANLRITSTGDTYFMFFNALSVDIIEPEIQLVKTVEDLAGNDIGGADVNLGDFLEYVISFQNLGNDDTTSFTITDILPNNTYFQGVTFSPESGMDDSNYSYDPVTETITFTIPDELVEENDPAYEIRLLVRVAESCNDLKDACSNIVQNSAYATYQGVLNSNVISNDPSIAGINGCGQPVTGPANFLVDIDDCNFERTVTLCSTSVDVSAPDGYDSYEWYDSDNNLIGTTQTITITAEGEYYVINTAAAPCVSTTEHVTVNSYSTIIPNPVIPFADETPMCANNGKVMPNIFLCGADDERLIQTGITDATSISWQKLDESDCLSACSTCDDLPSDCPWVGCPNSSWVEVATGQDYTADTSGQYRLVVNYDGCFGTFYFNVYKNLLDPQYTKENIICSNDGNITITNVPAGYEYQLVNQSTNTVVYDYSDGMGPSFDISASGIYTVNVRQQGVDTTPGNTYCEFSVENIGIQNNAISVNVITENATCDGLGSIRLQALNVGPQYYFEITGPSTDSHGPVIDNNHLFENLNAGTYNYTVTTDDGCVQTGTVTIIDESDLDLVASVSQNISCKEGNIQMSASGGRTPYIYAVYSQNGVLQNPTPSDFQTSVIFDVLIGDEGDYVFIVMDGNGCTTLSNEVTIIIVPDVEYTTSVDMVSCNGANDGSIVYNVTNTNGYNVVFDLLDATDTLITTNNSGTFTSLAPGDYTVILRQTKGNRTCEFPFDFTITEPDAITGGSAAVTQEFDCTPAGSAGATITVDTSTIAGGTPTYEYSIDGITFGTATSFTGLTAGTYTITVRDANNCTHLIDTIVIDPVIPPSDLTVSATTPSCPALTSDLTLTVTGGEAPFNYEITAPAAAVTDNGTNNVFTGLTAGTYTFMVTDSKGCTYSENYTIQQLTPISVNGQPVSNVTCFGAIDGALNFNVSGFSTNYTYDVVNGASTSVSSSASATNTTIALTGLAADTYTITVQDNVTGCTATATVTISAPSAALAITTTVNPITCLADGSLNVTATGGWGGYEYTLTQPDSSTVGPQSGSSFTGLTQNGTYTISVTDANNCTVTDTFTLTTPVPPTASISGSDICYDANGASLTVSVTDGTAPFTYSVNGNPGQSSNVFASLTPGSYTIVVTDAYGCTDSVSQTIAPTLTAMASFVKGLDCTGSPDAQISVAINGGTAAYTYEVSANGGTTYGSSASVTGSSISFQTATAGSYRFRITDANGCVVQSNIINIAPLTLPSITSATQSQAVLCNGDSSGAITVVVDNTTGTGPFTINVYNDTTSTDYGTQTTGLPAGSYTVTLTDANSCTDTVTVVITEPDPITFNVSIVPITCNNPDTIFGEIIVENTAGGTADYTYYLTNNYDSSVQQYSTTPGNEDHTFQVLNFGIYTLSVVDANGCTVVDDNIVIASPPTDLDISVTPTPPADCLSGGTASVTVQASVGSGNYEFAILEQLNLPYVDDPANDYQPANSGSDTRIFTGLIPGIVYTFVVHDITTNCYYFKSADIAIPPLSTLTSTIDTVNNVTCTGNADGNITFTIDNYDAATTQVGYEVYYAQTNTPLSPVVGGTIPVSGGPETVSNVGPLAPGTYYVLFTELDGGLAGCTNASAQFTIVQSAELLEVSAQVITNDNCNTNAGVISATAQGGTAPYQYLIQPSTDAAPTAGSAGWSSANSFNVEGGTYTVYAMDAYGCIQPIAAPITLDTDPSPVIALSVVQQCDTAEGNYSIQVDLTTAGMPPYTYSFNGGGYQAQSGTTFTYDGLPSGTYTVEVRDVNGCTNLQNITIYPPLNLTPAVTAQPTCATNDGEITVTAAGGSGNYTYELQDSSNAVIVAANASNVFTGQPFGDYIVVVTDTTTGCSETATVSLEEPTAVVFTYVSQNVSCNSADDGSIVVTLDPSNDNPVYTYTLDDGINPPIVQNSNTFTGLAAGTYDITVTSGKNCTATETVVITEPAVLTLTATATDFACDATNTVQTSVITATVGAGTGTAPYTYSIDGTNFFTTNIFEVVDNGAVQNITVTVKDSNNCTATFPLTINPLPEIISVVPTLLTEITCNNDETVTITVTGGSGDFTFDLLPLGSQASVTPGAGVYTATFDLTTPGSYNFQVTDNVTGCYEVTSTPYDIVPFDTIAVEATASTQVTCYGDADGTITINVTGYTGNYDFVVTDSLGNTVGSGSNATTTNPYTITGLVAGNHYVTITATDSPFCTADSNVITIGSPSNPLVLNASQTASVTCTNDQGEIIATATGGWGTYQYELVNNTTSSTVQAYASNSTFTGLAAGNYTVSVQDAGGCVVSQTIDLVQPAPITASISASATALLCNGDNTVTITATSVTGGEGVYQYILNTYDDAGTTIVYSSDAQISPSFNNLGAGIYSITVTDGWNCDVTTVTVEITEPDPIQAFLSLTDTLTCTTGAEITVSATGGTAPYQYSLDGVTYSTNTVFPIASAGTYQVYVTDANNCTAVLSNEVTILAVPPLTINLDLTNAVINCFGEATASITANVTGGLGNYSYELLDSGSNVIAGPQTENTFTGLATGTYYVHVISGDCEETSPAINITSPPEFIASVSHTDVLCYNEQNGSITVTASGGTGTVQYAISPNLDQFVDTNVFTNLAAGLYDVIAQDQNGCFELFQVEILNPALLEASIDTASLVDEVCLGDSNASITVNITGGTGTYEIAIDDLLDPSDDVLAYVPVTGTQHTFTNLAGGTAYDIYIRDSNGCDVNPQLQQYMPPGVDMTPSATVVDNCTNNVPGNVVTVEYTTTQSLNAADISYSVDGTNYQASNTFTDLAPGTYTAYVQHTNGCIKTVDFTIDNLLPITATAAATLDVLCKGDATGEITVTASGGTGTLQYAISPSFVYGTSNVFTGLTAGDYTVRVTDDLGCEFEITTVTIDEPTDALTATIDDITNEICFNDEDGTVTITVAGGTAPYFTSLDSNNPADFTQDLFTYTNLAPGTHTIYVTDANDCTITTPLTFDVEEGADMTPSATVVDNCTGNVPGNEVTINVASSQTLNAADLTYSVDGTTYQASNVFNNLAPGSYTAYVQHANGCIKTTTFTINTLQPIAIDTATVTADVLCFGDATGEITVTASGGTGTLQYAISPAFVYGTANVFTGLTAGDYTVRVTDALGCEIETTTLTVNEPTAALTASVDGVTDEICFNAADGTVTVTVTGGTAPYSTSLDGAAYVQDQFVYTGLTAGTHTINVMDANGCVISTPLTFTVNPGVSIQPTADTYPTCTNNIPGNVTFILTNPSIDPADLQYSLDGVNYQTSNTFADLVAGNYTAYVQHTNGCIQTVNFTINALQPIAIDSAVVTADVLCFGDATGEITVTASGGTGTLVYAISTDAANFTTNNVFTGLTAGTYTITVRDDIGCEITTGNIVVNEPTAPLSLDNAATTDEVCYNAADGTVTLTISGGTAPYYTSVDSSNPADFVQDQLVYTGLTVGTHTIYVTDDNGCAITPFEITINEGVDMTPSATVVDNCTNNVPGNEVTVNVASSQTLDPADMQYSVDGTTYQVSNVFNNLAPGNYTAYVQHVNGCIETTTFTINTLQPIAIDTATVTADVLCFGESTGEITVTASGGTGTLQYAISPAFVYGSANVFTGLPAGDYTVRVTDDIGCEVETATLTITEPTAPLSLDNAATTDEVCYNAADGTVTLTISGGTAPYYTSVDSSNPADFVQDQLVYTGLTVGTHTIYVTDDNGCAITPFEITINEGVDMTPSATVVDNCTNNVPGNEVTVNVASSQTLDPADMQYSVDGTTYQASNVFNNLAPGNYTAYVQHVNGCIETTTFTINTLQPITIDTATVTADVLCFGESTGEITVTASGGTGTLQYAISPAFVYGSANVFTGLPAGDYTVRVTDGIGCEVETATLTITEPTAPLSLDNAATTDEVCYNAADGTVTLTISGGTAPYYTSVDSSNPADFVQGQLVYTGLTAGTHTIYVTDDNGCAITPFEITINEGVDMTPSATVVDNCTNNVPGNEVTVNVASSQTLDPADMQYSLDGTNYQASNVFNNLAPGNYTAYVRHANGCVQTTTFTINVLQPVTASAVATTDVGCKGESTGEITVTASGGTGTLQYAISPDYIYGSSNVFSGLAAGSYTVMVTDGIGCEVVLNSVQVTEPVNALTSTIDVVTDEICFNDADGTVTISVTGGTPPYYTSLDSNNPADYAQDVFTYTGLTAGTHTIYVTDANGCSIPVPLTFDIEPGVSIQPVVEVYPTCTDNVPGNVVFVLTNPSINPADLTYSLDGVAYQTDNYFANLAPGNYTAYIQHTNGCVQMVDFTIDVHQPIVIDSAVVTADVLCFGESTGEITVTASGGIGTLLYAISSDAGNYTTNNVFSNLPAGTYTVSVADEIGCEITTANLVVTEPAGPLALDGAATTDEVCYNAADGTVTLTISGGTTPYFTSIDSDNVADFTQDQLVYTNLTVGMHTIYVTDANGCSITPVDFTINEGADMTPSAGVVDNCTNNVPGNEVTISVASSQTLDPADLTYSVDGTTYQASNVFNNLAPGNYTAYVQHANGCIETTTFTINTLQPITIDTEAVTADVSCKGEATGEITVTASGGTGTLQYAISPDFVYGSSNVFTNLPAGDYTVRVTDGIGCEVETATLTVDEPVEFLTSVIDVVTNEICFNAQDGTVTISVTGGTAPYFTSLDSNNPADFVQDVFTYTDLTAGTHTIYVTDANGCSIPVPLTFDVEPGADMTPSASVVDNCTNNVPGNEVTISVASSQTLDPADLTYSVDGTTYQVSNVFNNLAPGNYTAYVQHANGCIETTTFTINTLQPITIDTEAVTADVSCKGEATGEITVTASGGTGTLQYAISPDFVYGSSNVFTNLPAGDYTVRVTDGIGCEVETATLTIDEPVDFLTSVIDVVTNEICFNAQDGTVSISVTGGTAPYFTSLDSNNPADFVQDVFTYTGLAAGTHTIYVTDANGCSIPVPLTFDVEPGADMTPSASVVDNCTNNVPGNEVTISVASSQTLDPADLTYSVDGTTYQASNVFNNLAPGNYTAYVQHANGCIETTTFTINTLQPITIDTEAVTADVSCKGEATGEITVTASGGTGTLQYAISPDFVYGSSNVFTNLAAGTYTVRVTDGIGCEVETATLTVDEPVDFLTSVIDVVTNEICFNAQDGTVTISVTGGTAPYSTSLDGVTFVQDQFTYTDLAAGAHTIYVTDDSGCTITPIDFVIQQGVNTQPNVDVVANCMNNIPGNVVTINIDAQYLGEVQYSVDGVNYQASNTFMDLAAGTHTAYVQHINGCIQTVDFDVESHEPVNATATVTQNVICYGDDTGEIIVTATGGTGQLEYAISPIYTYSTNNTFSSLIAGTYTIRVRDELGCVQVINNVVITQSETQIIASADWTGETCYNANDGSITVTVSGGTAPYSTSLDGVTFIQDQFTYTNLNGGQHVLFVQDAAGCQIVPIVFNIEHGVVLNPVVEVTPICTNNVSLSMLTVTNINPAIVDDVMYSLDGVNYQSSNVFTDLPDGNYVVYVMHANGCVTTRNVMVRHEKPILGVLTVVDALCNGEDNGTITVNGSGGIGTLTYGISPDFNMTENNVFNVAAGQYTVRVQDETGCYKEYTATVDEPSEIILTEVEVYPEICENDDNAAILIDITGGTAPYSTSMDMDEPFEVGKDMYTDLDGGQTYTIYVKDANGCVASIDVWIDAPIIINAQPELVYNCDENVLTVNVETAVQGAVTYSLNGGAPQTSNTFTNLADGTYVVDVLHDSGCIDSTEPVTVTNTTALVMILAESDINEITATTTGGSGGYTYTLNGEDMGTDNVFEIYSTGTYVVTVTDSRGCVAEKSLYYEFVDIILPDVMSPNDDGINDTWAPGHAENYPNLEFFVFDRYGRKLATLRQGQEWDGRYNGQELPTGDYWYIVKLNNPEDDREFVGHFTIFR